MKRLMTVMEALEIMDTENEKYVQELKDEISLLVRERKLLIKCLKENRIEDLKKYFKV